MNEPNDTQDPTRDDVDELRARLFPKRPRRKWPRWTRILVSFLLGISLPFTFLVFMGACVYSAPRYQGPVTDHFDGKKFFNPGVDLDAERDGGFWKWKLTGEPGEWDDFRPAEPGARPPERAAPGDMRVTFIGHASVLLQIDGVNLLLDPIWSDRASPVGFAGPKRRRPPGLRFEDLPPIDAVLISHNHYDHLDLPTLERLAQAHDPLFVVPLGNDLLLAKHGLTKAKALDWDDAIEVAPGVTVTATQVQHWSARGLSDRYATLWCGFAIQGADAGTAYYAGDTGYGPFFADTAEKFGPIRLAILPIGAYLPQWFMAPSHQSPQEAVTAHHVLKAGKSLAVHFGTFRLADDGQDEPVEGLMEALAADDLIGPEDFWILELGEGRDVPPLAP
ncbi:MAG: MBL fold metallo-hydrolase [Sumerlaeia bacterium]